MTAALAAQLDDAQVNAEFLSILHQVETHANFYFRHVRCADRRADCIQESIAVCFAWFKRLRARGKDPLEFPTTLAGFATRHVRAGLKLCGQEAAKDAISPLAQARHGFVTQTLPECECGVEGNEAIDALRDNTITPPPDQAAFRCDYPAWLSSLGDRNRRIAEDMALGHTTQDLAPKHNVSQARISQLRRELHTDWRRFHGEQ